MRADECKPMQVTVCVSECECDCDCDCTCDVLLLLLPLSLFTVGAIPFDLLAIGELLLLSS
mgnify:CR=1 FL=1